MMDDMLGRKLKWFEKGYFLREGGEMGSGDMEMGVSRLDSGGAVVGESRAKSGLDLFLR